MGLDYRWKGPGAEFQRAVDGEKKALWDVDSGKFKHPFLFTTFVITVSVVMLSPGMLWSVYDIPELKMLLTVKGTVHIAWVFSCLCEGA